MSIKYHSSVFFVENIEKSKHFYCTILNQEIETDFGNNISLLGGLSLWQVPDWHSLNENFYEKKNPNKASEIYFETEDINQVINLIESHKIKIHHELVEESWGQKTIRIYDPDNNLIEIGESLKTFIRRMFSEGLNVEQISKKSGVPTNLIQEFIK